MSSHRTDGFTAAPEMKIFLLSAVAALSAALALTACTQPPPNGQVVKIANPASEYCVKVRGGRLDIVTDASGGQKGLCHLPDGTVIEEWELFRKENPQK